MKRYLFRMNTFNTFLGILCTGARNCANDGGLLEGKKKRQLLVYPPSSALNRALCEILNTPLRTHSKQVINYEIFRIRSAFVSYIRFPISRRLTKIEQNFRAAF